MNGWKRALALVLALMTWMPLTVAMADDDVEISFEDTSGIILEENVYDNVVWNFPVDLSDMDPELVRLANKKVLLPEDFIPDPLVTMKARKEDSEGNNTNGGVKKVSSDEMKLQEECAQHLVEMFDTALEEGITLYLKSAYRSYRTQKTMYYNRLENNNGVDDGWVAMPGSSDHQTGLGCDVVPRAWRERPMNGDMGKEKECIWMAENCHRFGFILRYPEDKQDVTEINYEPWHMRYVGVPVGAYTMENVLCLEEFQDQLQAAIAEFLQNGGRRSLVEDYIIKTDAD